MTYACLAIPSATASLFRTGVDDRGNPIRRMAVTDKTGFPCRHCLRFGRVGEEMLLGAYDLPRPRGLYWTPSPIFVHAAPCRRHGAAEGLAPIVREGSLLSVRVYDGDDLCLYDLGDVCTGATVRPLLDRALADQRTAFVNVHTARPGCFLTRLEAVAVARTAA